RTARLEARDVDEAPHRAPAVAALPAGAPVAPPPPRRLDEVRRPAHVDREELVRRPRLDDPRGVDDRVHPLDRLVHAVALLDAPLDELHVRQLLEEPAVRRLSHERAHAHAALREELGDVPPEETARARDEDCLAHRSAAAPLPAYAAPFVNAFSYTRYVL